MRRLRLLAIATVVLPIAACTPGYSVASLVATPAGATYEYTSSVSSEYGATVQKAELHCQQFGKHARPVGAPVQKSPDRSVQSFDCVAS